MGYTMGAATVPAGTTATALFQIPPGLCNVTFYNLATATVWVGPGSTVTSASGMQCHSIPTTTQAFTGTKGATLYGTTGSTVSTSVATVQYIIVTAQ